jgi:hypothetical protein
MSRRQDSLREQGVSMADRPLRVLQVSTVDRGLG